MTVVLDGSSLTTSQLAGIARAGWTATLSRDARDRLLAAREVVDEVLAASDAAGREGGGEPVYGLTTGVAERKDVTIPPAGRTAWNRLLVRSHRVAQGPLAPPELVRGTMTCLANSLAKGTAGVRPELVEMILDALAGGVVPDVRTLGSVGQSDLGAMADLADGLLVHSGFELAEGEGLALVNSNAFSTAWATLAILDARTLLDSCDVAAALDLEAFRANPSALHPVVAASRPYAGVADTLRRLHALLEGSSLFAAGEARNLQDPLTFRCVPQIHGAARDVLAYASGVIETELNASQGNPVVVVEERRVLSVGNFEILPVAAALDFLRIALAPVLTSAAERTLKLLQSRLSGLPAGLAEDREAGEDALAELAGASQSLAAEARLLAQPVSFELVSSTKAEGIEDRMTMAPLGARRLAEMVDLGARVLAVGTVVAAQALDLRRPAALGRGVGPAIDLVRRHARFTGRGEPPPTDLEPLVAALRRGELALEAEARDLS